MSRILSFGSLNMDLVALGGPIPRPGETVTARELRRVPGGKGANQAVGAARLGVSSAMIGRVGDDDFGTALLAALAREQVDCTQVQRDRQAGSGVALIAVNDAGENAITVIPGANGRVDGDDVARLRLLLPTARVLLLQLEVPLVQVEAAARAAQADGVCVILDPAPAQALPQSLLAATTILTPNQHEAATLVGFALDDDGATAAAAQELQRRGVAQVIIKLGSRGAYLAEADAASWYPAHQVNVVDSVAAGDAFNAALATALSEGRPLQEAVRWASAGGALAVTRAGAQDAMPTRTEIRQLMAAQPLAVRTQPTRKG